MDGAGRELGGDGIADDFARCVTDRFGPLLSAHGFKVERASSGLVVFASGSVEVSFSLEPMSYEIGFVLAARGHPEAAATLGDVLDAELGPGHGVQTFFQTSTPEGMQIAIEKMAGLVSEHCDALLAGEEEALRRVLAAARMRDEAYTARIVADPIRKEADEAWRVRDYNRVVALYGSIESGLTGIEARRLAYSRRCV